MMTVNNELTVKYIDQSIALQSWENCIKFIADIATLSYGNLEARNPERLFTFLLEQEHYSVFEFVRVYDYTLRHHFELVKQIIKTEPKKAVEWNKKNVATFYLKVPIFVARQIMRHRAFSYLEMSRRYVTAKKIPFEFYIPDIDENLKQEIIQFYQNASELYQKILQAAKPEVARIVLPVSLYTQFYMQGDRKAWSNFLYYRLQNNVQPETRTVAEKIYTILKELWPDFQFK